MNHNGQAVLHRAPYLAVIVNENNLHWWLAVVRNPLAQTGGGEGQPAGDRRGGLPAAGALILILDSLGPNRASPQREAAAEFLRGYLAREMEALLTEGDSPKRRHDAATAVPGDLGGAADAGELQ